MEEKYTQLKLNLDSLQSEENEQINASSENDDDHKVTTEIFDDNSSQLDDDLELVSPDEDIFIKVTENVNNDKKQDTLTSEWHDDTVDSGDNFILDESFASTAHADRQFMETFGLRTSNSLKTVSDKKDAVRQESSYEDTSSSEGYEYTERLQNQEIKSMYDYAIKSIGRKLLFSAIITVLLFAIENIALFIKGLPSIFYISNYPYLHIGVGTGLLVLCAVCAREQLYHGIKSIASKEYFPESVSVISFAVAMIHNIASIVLVSFGNKSPIMFNFVASAVFVGTILYSFVNVVREEYGFRAISGKEAKFILEKVYQDDAEAEYDTFTTTSNGEYCGQIARIGRTGFIKKYFYNTNSTADMRKFMGIYYLVTLILSLVAPIYNAIVVGNGYSFTSYWGVSFMLMMPVGALCAYSVPFYLGNKKLFDDGVSIIGEDAVKEYSRVDVVVVNDTTAFPPQNVKLQNLHVYNDFTIEKVLYYAYKGFSVVGGALSEVFEAAANEIVTSTKGVRFKSSGRGYLSVRVDGESVIFADKFGMSSQGIEIGNEKEIKDGISTMYIAVEGVLAAKLYIKYAVDEEFLRIAKLLNKNGTGIGIRTFDPNLSNDLVKKLTAFKKKDLRVIKLSSLNEITKQTEAKEAKVVSNGRSMSLIKAIPVCKKILTSRKVIKAIKIIASIGGAALAGLWVFGKLTFAYSAHIVGYHLVFALIMMLSSLITMPKLK